ncbi:MAG TPA: DUF167 domain-containing protein [Methanomicrobia archaeon]|nr:DUF167 domain-containing protein [Methanomicrobia archaeon]
METRTIKVIPNARADEVIEAEPLIVRVTAAPTKGRANKAVVQLLSAYFNANVRIVAGASSRKKVVEIEHRD